MIEQLSTDEELPFIFPNNNEWVCEVLAKIHCNELIENLQSATGAELSFSIPPFKVSWVPIIILAHFNLEYINPISLTATWINKGIAQSYRPRWTSTSTCKLTRHLTLEHSSNPTLTDLNLVIPVCSQSLMASLRTLDSDTSTNKPDFFSTSCVYAPKTGTR